jgi:carboxylesterase
VINHHDFMLEGGNIGVLLIHGLTGTPTEMRGVGREFNRAGFTVYGMQLAGHCGDVDDLIATNWKDWYQSVIDAAEKLRSQVDYLYVGGLSMGAVLALKYASDFPERTRGVLVYGATFRFDGWTVPLITRILAPGFLIMTDILHLGRRRIFNEEPPYGIRNEQLRRKISQSMLSGDSGAAGLAGNPWPSLSQLVYLTRNVRRSLHRITSPCLIMHAENDDIAHRRNGELVRDNVRGPVKMVLLKNSYHMITIDNDRRELVSRSITFIQQNVPQTDRNGGSQLSVPGLQAGLNSTMQSA